MKLGGNSRILALGVGGASALGSAVGITTVAASPVVPAGALVAAAGLLGTLRAPLLAVLGFVVIACLLPFAVIPVRIGVALTFVDVALTLLLVVCFLRVLRERAAIRTTPIDGLVALFVAAAVVSFIIGSGYSAVAGEQFRLFLKLLNSVLFFFMVVQVVRSRQDVIWVVRTFLAAGGIAGGLAVALYFLPRDTTVAVLSALRPFGYPSGPEVIRLIAGTETARATGTSIDPNVLGGLLMLVAVMAGAALMKGRLLPRPLLIAILAFALAGIVLSYSRSSWVGLAAGLGFLAGFRERRAWILVGVGVAAITLLPQGTVLIDRFTSGLQARDQAAAMRVAEYEDALNLILRYPLFGVGFGGAPTIELYVAVSSIYLLIAEEMGLVGLSLFLGAVGAALLYSFQPAPRGPGWVDAHAEMLTAVIAALQATLVAALVAGLFDHYLFNIRFPHMAAVFWLLVALLLIATRLAREPAGVPRTGQTSGEGPRRHPTGL